MIWLRGMFIYKGVLLSRCETCSEASRDITRWLLEEFRSDSSQSQVPTAPQCYHHYTTASIVSTTFHFIRVAA